MKQQAVKVMFVFPSTGSPWAKKKYANMKRFLQKMKKKANRGQLTIHIGKPVELDDPYAFDAHVEFEAVDEADAMSVSAKTDPSEEIPVETEETVRNAAESVMKQPLFLQLLPSRRILILMEQLEKPVKVEVLTRVCSDLYHIPDSTVRGTLNKHRDIYISPKHGLWMLKKYAEQQGYCDYRR